MIAQTLMFCLVDAVRMMVLDPTIPVKINAMTYFLLDSKNFQN